MIKLRNYCYCLCFLSKQSAGADQLASLISAFVFATQIVQFLYFLNPKFSASSGSRHLFFACAARFVSDLFGNHIAGFLMKRLISYKEVAELFKLYDFLVCSES